MSYLEAGDRSGDRLDNNQENGKIFVESVYEKSNHGPHIEEEAKFVEDLKSFIASIEGSARK